MARRRRPDRTPSQRRPVVPVLRYLAVRDVMNLAKERDRVAFSADVVGEEPLAGPEAFPVAIGGADLELTTERGDEASRRRRMEVLGFPPLRRSHQQRDRRNGTVRNFDLCEPSLSG